MMVAYLLLMGGGVIGSSMLFPGTCPARPVWSKPDDLGDVAVVEHLIPGRRYPVHIGEWRDGVWPVRDRLHWRVDRAVWRVLKNQSAVNVGIVSSLIMPSEAVWKRAAYEMQSSLVRTFGGLSPFSSPSAPSLVMVLYAVFYAAVVLWLAMRRFSKRDL